ncbi:nucleotidyltransferase family protein [Blastomonas sp.]|uniref:nucleotidyltransferase family protein n=1 Tax=Blastomonas sp. TaxID=1909299 RepID=UPI00391A9D39
MISAQLDEERLAVLASVLQPYAHRIDKVAVFGSHAMGRARRNSDIDLVIYGRLDEGDIDRIWTLLDESPLAVTVDVVGYNLPLYPPLRAHIDRTAQTLFMSADLADLKAA